MNALGRCAWLALLSGVVLGAAAAPAPSRAPRPASTAVAAAPADPWRIAPPPPARLDTAAARLPEGPVRAIVESPVGFPWLHVGDRWGRWTGARFEPWPPEVVLAHRAVPVARDLAPAGTDSILVATDDGVEWLHQRDGRRERLVGAAPLRGPVERVMPDGEGGAWVAAGHGVVHVSHGRAEALVPWPGEPAGATLKVAAMLRAGGVGTHPHTWIGTSHGLFRATSDTGLARIDAVGADAITALLRDRTGAAWIGTASGRLHVLSADGRDPAPVRQVELPTAAAVTALALRPDGTPWVATADGGLWAVVDVSALPVPPLFDGGARCVVRAMGPLRTGGTLVAGDCGLVEAPPGWGLVGVARGWPGCEAAAACGDAVTALLSTPDGHTWIASASGPRGVVVVLDAQHRPVRTITTWPVPFAAPAQATVQALAVVGDRVVAATTMGVYQARGDGSELASQNWPGRDAQASVAALAVGDDHLWVGGADGLWDVRPGMSQWRGERPAGVDRAALDVGPVAQLAMDATRHLWIRGERRIVRYPPGAFLVEAESLPATPRVRTAAPDPAGAIWLAGEGGVSVMDPALVVQGLPVGRLPLKGHRDRDERGGALGEARGLALDLQGRMWIASTGALHVVEPVTGYMTTLPLPAGAPDATPGAATVLGDGTLLFGATGGLLVAAATRVPTPVAPQRAPPRLDEDDDTGTHVIEGGARALVLWGLVITIVVLVVLVAKARRAVRVRRATLPVGLAAAVAAPVHRKRQPKKRGKR